MEPKHSTDQTHKEYQLGGNSVFVTKNCSHCGTGKVEYTYNTDWLNYPGLILGAYCLDCCEWNGA